MTFNAHKMVRCGVCLCVVAMACESNKKSLPHTEQKRSPIQVTKGDLVNRLTLTGKLDFSSALSLVTPRTPSWNIALRFLKEDGAQVTKGERVAEFDNSSIIENIENESLALSEAKNALAIKKNELRSTTLDGDFALFEAENAFDKARLQADLPHDLVPKAEYQDKQLALLKAEHDLEEKQESLSSLKRSSAYDKKIETLNVESAERQLENTKHLLESIVLKASQDGVWVVADNLNEGRKLQEGDSLWPSAEVGRISNLDELIVKASLSDVDDGSIHPGMNASITLDAYPDRIFPGTIESISPIAKEPRDNSLRRQFDVTVTLAERDTSMMRPGMSVKVELITKTEENVKLISRQSLIVRDDAYLIVNSDGREIPVEISSCNLQACSLHKDFDSEKLSDAQ